jgi:hypothetical protein
VRLGSRSRPEAESLRGYGSASCRSNSDFGSCISGTYENMCCPTGASCTSDYNACYFCEVNPDLNGGAACFDNDVIISCLEQYNCRFEDYPPWYRYSTSSSAHCDKSVMYKGYSYSPLDVSVGPLSTITFCQDMYLPIPAGWSIAPDDDDSIHVTASFTWGTHLMVLQGGAQYYTSHPDFASRAEEQRDWVCCNDGQTALGQSGSEYRVNACVRRILLKYTSGLCCASVSFLQLFPSASRMSALPHCSAIYHALWWSKLVNEPEH